jgi:hypothetical protein
LAIDLSLPIQQQPPDRTILPVIENSALQWCYPILSISQHQCSLVEEDTTWPGQTHGDRFTPSQARFSGGGCDDDILEWLVDWHAVLFADDEESVRITLRILEVNVHSAFAAKFDFLSR